MKAAATTGTIQNTSHKVVLPFYIYAAVAFLVSTVLLLLSGNAFVQHYFHPHTLAITHAMALGWGTMIILGASHQLVPVLIERKLFSDTLAGISFSLAALGIPLLVYAFYVFDIGWPAQLGGILINAAVLVYLINLACSITKSKSENIHVIFVFTSACWLLATTTMGLLLVYNFSYSFFDQDSLRYLPLHAHLGIAGWFLLLILGIASRLIPMFLISKYENPGLLWSIYSLINAGLLLFFVSFIYFPWPGFYLPPVIMIGIALALFSRYIYRAYQERIRKSVDKPMQLSLMSVLFTVIPLLLLALVIATVKNNTTLELAYGFTIFFGTITSIILGMTFKTLPFIVWNKIYHAKAGLGKTPDPRQLFNQSLFGVMTILYLSGFALFTAGIISSNTVILKVSAVLLVATAVLYNLNVFKIVQHRPVRQ